MFKEFIIMLICLFIFGCVVYFGNGKLRKSFLLNEPCFGCCERAINNISDPIGEVIKCSDIQGCTCN